MAELDCAGYTLQHEGSPCHFFLSYNVNTIELGNWNYFPLEVNLLDYTLVTFQKLPFKRWANFLYQRLVLHPRGDLNILANLLTHTHTAQERGVTLTLSRYGNVHIDLTLVTGSMLGTTFIVGVQTLREMRSQFSSGCCWTN